MTPSKKILVVDDTEATRYAVARTLKKEGYEIVEAGTGQEALDLVLREKPDLVTLDIHLPDILGFEVCRRIKGNPETQHIPVLQVSASFVTSRDRIHGLEGGADSYLTHPFEPPVLIATVKALLRTSQLVENLKVTEEKLRLALEEAKEASEAKSRFLSNMSHEIRTPLGVIQGFADLALNLETQPEERRDYLLTIKRNAQNLTKLIGGILDLSKIEAGKMDLDLTRVSLMELVSDVLDTLSLQAREKGLALHFTTEGRVPSVVKTDLVKLRQILLNLIGNAIKFTEKGHIKIRLKVFGEEHDPTLEFLVEDTGIGLSEDEQKRLFQAFVQADSSTTRKFGGTGLGLSLSKRLAQFLGGDLNLVSSHPGQGSVFAFHIRPGVLSQKEQRAALSSQSAVRESSTKTLSGFKVLLVEDSLDNQKLISLYLDRAGAEVDIASDGQEAVEKARLNCYDVILMDVQMPVLDGYAATRILREGQCVTPIIALTAHALMEEKNRALSLGFDDYLTKPLNPVLLIKTLAAYSKAYS